MYQDNSQIEIWNGNVKNKQIKIKENKKILNHKNRN